MEKEVRTLPIDLEIRMNGKNEPVIFGKAAVYGSRSVVMRSWDGNFTEVIEPGFFSDVLESDVVATVEHNNEKLVGRTSAGTLKLYDSQDALRTENNLPLTTVGNDLRINIERGEIRGMSFAFCTKEDGCRWETDKTTGAITRTLLPGGCEALYDVTYTCNPAYQDTAVAMRSIEKIEKEKREVTDEAEKEAQRLLAEKERERKVKLAKS